MKLLRTKWVLLLAGIIVGIVIGIALKPAKKSQPSQQAVILKKKTTHPLLNPVLDCGFVFEEISPNLEGIIFQKVQELKKRESSIKEISVYFRHLQDGQWITIHGKEKFIPASLTKVPLMIAVYKMLETYPEADIIKLTYDESFFNIYEQTIKGSQGLKNGELYSVRELIKHMIIYSDNGASTMLMGLVDEIDPELFNKVFSELGISIPGSNPLEREYQISIIDYSGFFRILYNASYLSTKSSQEALQWLTQAEFTDGVAKAVPAEITVAHKFGERNSENLLQLHDCGIIYYPKNHYLLGVMIKGNDFEKMKTCIQEISGLVYEKIDARFK